MSNEPVPLKFLLVGLGVRHQTKEKTLATFEELQSLVTTFGGVVVDATSQNFSKADSATYIGKGKTEEIGQRIREHEVDVVVINDIIKAAQIYNLEQIWKEANPQILVWDRINLILNIFEKRATSIEAKLQIKLAKINHRGPELQGVGKTMSQQGGGIGSRGMGETTSEVTKRQWKEEIRKIQKDLAKVTENRSRQMDYRKRSGQATVSIVGYTNAGKSTLFQRLTKKNTYIKDELFATLDSSVGSIYLPALKTKVFVTDTIGFIENLPHNLIEAFKSTLLETINADLILLVIDASDEWREDKIRTVQEILADLVPPQTPQIFVFNKIDVANPADFAQLTNQYQAKKPQFISAKTGENVDQLLQTIAMILPQKELNIRV